MTKISQADQFLTTRMFKKDIAARLAAGLDEVVTEPRQVSRIRQRRQRKIKIIKPPAVVLPPAPIAVAMAAPVPIVLRPDQERLIEEIRGALRNHMRVMAQAPTAFGKGIVIGFMVKTAVARGRRVLILGHKIEIVEQLSANLTALGIEHGIVAPGHPATDHAVQVAMISTVARRHSPVEFDLVLVDEAHHGAAKSWLVVIETYPEAFIVGFSATPLRLDGRPLDMFQTLIVAPGTAELIAGGLLSNYILYAAATAPDVSGVKSRGGDYATEQLARVMMVIVQSAVTEYERICPGASAIVFCVDIAHSLAVVQAFLAAGYRAAHVDGNTKPAERRRLIAALGRGELDILCNCGLISEGVDIPAVTAAILLRPTQSLALHLQQVGRVLRKAPGKTEAIILDLAGNTWRHGLPDAQREWSLEGRATKQREAPASVARLRHCTGCGAINAPGTPACRCGAVLSPTPAERKDVAMALVRADQAQMRKLAGWSYSRCVEWAGADEGRLQMVATARGYQRGWVWHQQQQKNEGAL